MTPREVVRVAVWVLSGAAALISIIGMRTKYMPACVVAVAMALVATVLAFANIAGVFDA